MPQYRTSTITHESFEALLDALGFEDVQIPHEAIKGRVCMDVTRDICETSPTPGLYNKIGCLPSLEEEEALEFSQTYLSDYDIGSDFDEDGSDYSYDDTLPSRPSSIFEMVQVDAHAPAALECRLDSWTPSPRSSVSSTSTATSRSPTRSSLRLSRPPQHRYCLYNASNLDPAALSLQSPHIDSLPPSETVCIKAALNASIIMLRVPRAISLEELKQRLHQKFATQEGISLRSTFSVVNVVAPCQRPTRPGVSRTRSESMTSGSPIPSRSFGVTSQRRVSFAERTEMQFVDSEVEWRRILSMHDEGSKVALRILDTSP